MEFHLRTETLYPRKIWQPWVNLAVDLAETLAPIQPGCTAAESIRCVLAEWQLSAYPLGGALSHGDLGILSPAQTYIKPGNLPIRVRKI